MKQWRGAVDLLSCCAYMQQSQQLVCLLYTPMERATKANPSSPIKHWFWKGVLSTTQACLGPPGTGMRPGVFVGFLKGGRGGREEPDGGRWRTPTVKAATIAATAGTVASATATAIAPATVATLWPQYLLLSLLQSWCGYERAQQAGAEGDRRGNEALSGSAQSGAGYRVVRPHMPRTRGGDRRL